MTFSGRSTDVSSGPDRLLDPLVLVLVGFVNHSEGGDVYHKPRQYLGKIDGRGSTHRNRNRR